MHHVIEPVVQQQQQQQHPTRSAVTILQELYRAVARARDAEAAARAEKERLLNWEDEQDTKRLQIQAEMEKQIADMRRELDMVKAYLSLHPNMPVPASLLGEEDYDAVSTTAHIEAYASPDGEELMSPVSPVLQTPQEPMFIEGSSSRPLTAQRDDPYSASPTMFTPEYPTPNTGVGEGAFYSPQMHPPHLVGPPTPTSNRPSPAPLTPGPEAITRKRPRHVVEDDTDYDSDSDDGSDVSAADRTLKKRKNGHDGRCLKIRVSELYFRRFRTGDSDILTGRPFSMPCASTSES